MISYLNILIFVIIVQIILLGIIISDLELDIEECDLSYNQDIPKKFNIKKLKVNVKLYWFKKVKILKIKIYKNYCEIFKWKVKLDVLQKMKDDEEYGILFIIKNIGRLKPKIKNINMEFVGGTEDLLITTFLIPTFSTILFSFISKNIKWKNKEKKLLRNCSLKVIPSYINKNNFSINGTTQINFDTMRTLFFIKKHRQIKI